VGRGKKLLNRSLPFVAVPTTAGTGAEVTKNAVLCVTELAVKVSLRSDGMLPAHALVDPLLTLTCPPATTASCGLDALTQCLEPFVSCAANAFTDIFAREGLARAARSLRAAYDDGSDVAAREDMMMASLLGGLALANAKLGAVHGFAGPLGGMYDAPHGALCAATLPHVVAANVAALRARAPDGPYLARFVEVARILTGRSDAVAEDAAPWLLALTEHLKVTRLGEYGVTAADIPTIVEKAAAASSMKGNPLVLTSDELTDILQRSL
jgi:alcohol dehydrogenase class IV